MNKMTRAYLECALWASTDDESEPLDRDHDITDFSPESVAKAEADCARFYEANGSDLCDVSIERAGHDLWLTRNRHGAGFWDRGLGDVGDRLTTAAHAMGETDCYVGDDGKVYLS